MDMGIGPCISQTKHKDAHSKTGIGTLNKNTKRDPSNDTRIGFQHSFAPDLQTK
jgi:hypothetical protein